MSDDYKKFQKKMFDEIDFMEEQAKMLKDRKLLNDLRNFRKGVKAALSAGVSPDELKKAIANLIERN